MKVYINTKLGARLLGTIEEDSTPGIPENLYNKGEEVGKLQAEYLKEIGFKSYYTRTLLIDCFIQIDYGSHTNFLWVVLDRYEDALLSYLEERGMGWAATGH